MSQPYIGEIRMFGGNFAPVGWMFCEGQLLPISENDALFNLIGTTYGGDGQTTFALPDLRGRLPVHQGSGSVMVEAVGVEQVTLTLGQNPIHTHPLMASTGPGNANTPGGNVTSESAAVKIYYAAQPTVAMAPQVRQKKALSNSSGVMPSSSGSSEAISSCAS